MIFIAHDRNIIGTVFYRNPTNRQFILISVAHDSIKYWTV